MRFSVEDAIAAGLWVALGILALLSASDDWSTRTFLVTSEEVNHAHEVVQQLDHLLARGAYAHASARLTRVVVLVSDLLALGLVGSSYVIAMRGLAERRRHVVAVEEARGQAERQAGELAVLARDRDEARRAAQEAS